MFGRRGRPVKQARVYGIVKPDAAETPYSFAETYGDKNHSNPLYGEHFAVGDVPPGSISWAWRSAGRRCPAVTVEDGKLTWVVFRP